MQNVRKCLCYYKIGAILKFFLKPIKKKDIIFCGFFFFNISSGIFWISSSNGKTGKGSGTQFFCDKPFSHFACLLLVPLASPPDNKFLFLVIAWILNVPHSIQTPFPHEPLTLGFSSLPRHPSLAEGMSLTLVPTWCVGQLGLGRRVQSLDWDTMFFKETWQRSP